MLYGERTIECQHCYNIEDGGGKSVRQMFVEKWPLITIIDNTDWSTGEVSSVGINYLDLSWSNKCNLQCKMCMPTASDQLINEFKSLRLIPHDRELNFITQWKFDQIEKVLQLVQTPELTRVLVTGGEPLINGDFYQFCKQLIQSGLSVQVDLSIHTNLTVLPTKWLDIWGHFKSITFKISIDAVDEMYEYVRYPGKWNIIKENITRVIQYSNDTFNCGVEFHTVFSVFNTHKFTSLLDYLMTLDGPRVIHFPHVNYIYDPNHASPSNLPIDYKIMVHDEIFLWLEKNRSNFVGERILSKVSILESIIKLLLSMPASDINAKNCYSVIHKMDSYRHHDTQRFLPWWNSIRQIEWE